MIIQALSHVRPFVTPWTAARQASLSITNSWRLLRLMSIESVMPASHLTLCRPLSLPPSVITGRKMEKQSGVGHVGGRVGERRKLKFQP